MEGASNIDESMDDQPLSIPQAKDYGDIKSVNST